MHAPSRLIAREQFEHHPLLSRLLTLAQVPKELHLHGELPHFEIDTYGRLTPRVLAVVGSRKHSQYGKDVVQRLIKDLAGHPIIILSGLALGIDSLAHKAALTNNLITFSIPGSGLGSAVLYPRTHARLAEEIVSRGGVLLSEFEDDTLAAKWTFPARNRLVAALSDAVIIVEAEEQSGGLITARQALELGKDIGVIPGSIFSSTSRGTHMLLREGATPITSANDILELLHLEGNVGKKEIDLSTLSPEEKIIFEILSENKNKDAVISLSGLLPHICMIAITSLEMKGYIQETFGELKRVV